MPRLARVSQSERPREARTAAAVPAPQTLRYFAFLSYSHQDERLARWLHDSLERFRVPRSLAGRITANGVIPSRLGPIFRDRRELPASQDLGAEINEALATSRFLIVLCSPAAARSRWTNAEIESFKRLRPEGCILAAIVAGEPFASEQPGREAEECLPPALRFRYDRRGRSTGKRAEPLASDLREGGDGRRLGLLKLVAGLLGVGLDDLVQRESLRRQRRLAWIAAASLAGMIVTSSLAVVALQARDAARDQRREAEGLVGFILGDLRSKLEPLERLDELDSVGARALRYYQGQDKASLSDESLAQRSRALTLMGEIANTRGDLDSALPLYREALEGTAEALRRDPDNAQRMFDHAQNVFWVGYIAWQRGDLRAAERAFQSYRDLAGRMVAAEPQRRQWRLESIAADTNLGALLLQQSRFRDAAGSFANSTAEVERLAAAAPSDPALQQQLSQSRAYLSEALEKSGRLEDALAQRERQIEGLELTSRARSDMRVKRGLVAALRSRGRLLAAQGELAAGLAEQERAARLAQELFRTEPDNTEWMEAGAAAELELGETAIAAGELAKAGIAVRAGCDLVSRLRSRDSSVATWRSAYHAACLRMRALLALRSGNPGEASSLAGRAVRVARTEPAGTAVERALVIAANEAVRGDSALAAGNRVAAADAYRRALAAWPEGVELEPRRLALRAILLHRAGRRAEAEPLTKRLAAIGYRHPDYLKAISKGGSS